MGTACLECRAVTQRQSGTGAGGVGSDTWSRGDWGKAWYHVVDLMGACVETRKRSQKALVNHG